MSSSHTARAVEKEAWKVLPLYPSRWTGVAVAAAVLVCWLAGLLFALDMNLAHASSWSVALLVFLLTVLYTGLFVTAHDAMHGLVYPSNRYLNNFIGVAFSFLYALFSFHRMEIEHWKHHSNPATEQDPDYHDGIRKAFPWWYGRFLSHYVTGRQLIGVACAYALLRFVAHVPDRNLLLFWLLPNVLSTLQVFLFGTYLPHRRPTQGYNNAHRARSLECPTLLSFLTCFHLGYHYEHHRFPFLPWWTLPRLRREELQSVARRQQSEGSKGMAG